MPTGRCTRLDDRTEGLLSQGRRSARYFRFTRTRMAVAGTAIAAVLATVGVTVLVTGGASWPAGVAAVERQAGIGLPES